MEKITLRRENVVKEAASEDAAKALEAKGFVRDGAPGRLKTAAAAVLEEEAEELKGKLAKACEAVAASNIRFREKEEELQAARAKLADAEERVSELELELQGTREQLEAAVRKNAGDQGKKRQAGGGQ